MKTKLLTIGILFFAASCAHHVKFNQKAMNVKVIAKYPPETCRFVEQYRLTGNATNKKMDYIEAVIRNDVEAKGGNIILSPVDHDTFFETSVYVCPLSVYSSIASISKSDDVIKQAIKEEEMEKEKVLKQENEEKNDSDNKNKAKVETSDCPDGFIEREVQTNYNKTRTVCVKK